MGPLRFAFVMVSLRQRLIILLNRLVLCQWELLVKVILIWCIGKLRLYLSGDHLQDSTLDRNLDVLYAALFGFLVFFRAVII
jgi:hypothetical protein